MATRCEVLERAAKLSLRLEAYRIPDGFEATGKHWEVVAKVRDEYTNYRKLLDALDECPGDDNLTTTGRSGYDTAREILDTEARELAKRLYGSWYAQRNKVAGTAYAAK